MTHYYIELALWMLLAYFVGCAIGWILKNIFGRTAASEAVAHSPVIAPPVVVAPVPLPVMIEKPAVVSEAPIVAAPPPTAAPVPVVGKMDRPKGIAAARGNKPDKLQRISGIGPKNESILHTLGFFHFDQLAAWTTEQVTWVDDHLRFNGRIAREEWIKQAQLLADGKEAEFLKKYGTGGVRNNKGETLAGTRTRKP